MILGKDVNALGTLGGGPLTDLDQILSTIPWISFCGCLPARGVPLSTFRTENRDPRI